MGASIIMDIFLALIIWPQSCNFSNITDYQYLGSYSELNLTYNAIKSNIDNRIKEGVPIGCDVNGVRWFIKQENWICSTY